jgi:hypothetical protein
MDRGEVGEGWVPYHSFLTDIFAGVHIERATASVEPRNKNENRRPRAI